MTTATSLVAMRPARGRLGRASIVVRHLLFSGGVSDGARLRGWDRWYRWREHATTGQRLREMAQLALLPAHAAHAALLAVREYGDEVRRHCGVSRARQFAQLWWLRVAHGIGLDAYINLQLYRPERRRRAARYVQVGELNRVYKLVIARTQRPGQARMLYDKRKFDAWCRANELRSIPTLLEIDRGEVTSGPDAIDSLPPRDLFSKPANASSGVGALLWRYEGGRGYVGADGRARCRGELADELRQMSLRLGRPIIVQECLRNHRSLAALTPGALCTIRLMTYRPPRGAVRLLFGAYKMPVGDSVADNVAQGAVVAHVDLASGRLGRAVHRPGKLFESVERHPDTGALIAGVELPWWTETVDLVLRAHEAVGGIMAVGWDVAMLPDGPLLIEGNTRPSSRIAQLASGIPLTDTPFVRCVHEYLRESFAL